MRALGSGQLSGALLQTQLAACMLQPEIYFDCDYVAKWRLEVTDRRSENTIIKLKHQVRKPAHRLCAKASLCTRKQTANAS